MKSLIIKTLLIVSAVSLTTAVAFSVQDCNPDWKPGIVCDKSDKALEMQSGGASSDPVRTYCDTCGAEMRTQARIDDQTSFKRGSSGSSGSPGSASSPGTGSSNTNTTK